MDSAILGDHHCFRFRCDPTRLVITDAIAAAESGPTHNRLDMSCPTAKMTGSSKAATNNDNDNDNSNREESSESGFLDRLVCVCILFCVTALNCRLIVSEPSTRAITHTSIE